MSNQAVFGRGVGVALGLDAFADHAGAVGDEAVDHGDVGSVDDAFEVVGEGDVLRHEDVRVDAGGGGVGGEGSGGVAGGGDGEVLEAVVFRHGDGEAEAAGFEGAGGVGAFFLDEEAGVALAVEHGRPAFAEGDGSRRQEGRRRSATCRGWQGDGGGVGGDVSRLRGLLERVHVVADVEGPGAEGAEGLRGVGGEVMMTSRAFKRSNSGHILDVTGISVQRLQRTLRFWSWSSLSGAPISQPG